MSRTQRELKALRQQQREEAAARQRARDRRNLYIIGGVLGAAALAILLVALHLNNLANLANKNRLTFQTVSGTTRPSRKPTRITSLAFLPLPRPFSSTTAAGQCTS